MISEICTKLLYRRMHPELSGPVFIPRKTVAYLREVHKPLSAEERSYLRGLSDVDLQQAVQASSASMLHTAGCASLGRRDFVKQALRDEQTYRAGAGTRVIRRLYAMGLS